MRGEHDGATVPAHDWFPAVTVLRLAARALWCTPDAVLAIADDDVQLCRQLIAVRQVSHLERDHLSVETETRSSTVPPDGAPSGPTLSRGLALISTIAAIWHAAIAHVADPHSTCLCSLTPRSASGKGHVVKVFDVSDDRLIGLPRGRYRM